MFDEFVQSSKSQPAQQTALGGGFEREDGRTSPRDEFVPLTALETGFISSGNKGGDVEEQPIFQLGRVQYALSAPLALLCVSANILTMCLYAYPSPARIAQGAAPAAPPKLVRIDLDDPERTLEADVPLPPAPRHRNAPLPDPSLQGPHKMFSDPTGRHLILSTRAGDNYYWISGWRRARPLNKLKGLVIESVAWNQSADASVSADATRSSQQHRRLASGTSTPTSFTTREILIGTQSGDIYETVLSATNASDNDDGDFLDRLARRTTNTVGVGGGQDVDRYLTLVYRLQERQPVTGITSEIFIASQPARAVVIVTTSTRIYEFVGELQRSSQEHEGEGSGLYNKLFAPYKNDAIPNLKSELPGDLPYSELHTWSPRGKRLAKALAWLTGPGIYHGLLAYNSQQIGESVIDSANLLPYPAVQIADPREQDGETIAEIPLSIALAEYHFLLLYRDRVMAISSLDDQVVYQETLPLQPQERVIATATDPTRKTYWIYTDASIFEVVVNAEDRHAWRIHLDRGQFELALKFAKSATQRDVVLSAHGDHYFGEGRFIQAAQCYAQSSRRTFEEVTLRFIDKNERDALRYYLVMRLERLRRSDLTQRMMLATWLVEIYLAKINELEDIAAAQEASQNVDNYRIELDLLIDELKQFLSTYESNLDPRTTFGLITSHGRNDLMLHYASITGDHDRIVRHWIREAQWTKALAAISTQPSLELYYIFASTLMRHAPAETVDAWIRQDRLSPRRLMPAFVQYRPVEGQGHEVIRYLQHVARAGSIDTLLHNYLIRLLVERDEQGLMAQIASTNVHPVTGQPLYDLNYALRICSDRGKTEACVRIYAKMGKFESAVDLAIKAGNVDLACTCADAVLHRASPGEGEIDLAESRTTLRKKLWLRIARHVVEKEGDISTAMAFLKRAPDLLSIEDILPFFPDFTVIDAFKKDIFQALEAYSERIEGLNGEMDQATQSAEAIRADTQNLARRFVTVDAKDTCSVCQEQVLRRQFYVFACGHAFHADCLIAETTRSLPPRTLRRILILQDRLSRLTGGAVPALPPSYADAVSDEAVRVNGRGALSSTQLPTVALQGGLNMLGLDRLRDLVLPDVIVGAISTSVSMSVAGGRKVLAPLDPFADPTASMRAANAARLTLEDSGSADGKTDGKDDAGRQSGRVREEEEQIEALRDELDSLVASSCLLCDGSVQAINRPFITDTHDLEDWEL